MLDSSFDYTIPAMVNLGITGMRYIQGTIMSMPVELPRFMVRISMLCVVLLLLFGHSTYRTRRISNKPMTGSACVIAAVLCGIIICVFNFSRYGHFFANFSDPSARNAYVTKKRNEYIPGQLVSNNDFPPEKRITLEEAEIDFSASAQGITIRVEYIARVDEKTNAQSFTLYSDFQVDGVWVDGKQVLFKRSNDGILVYFHKIKNQGDDIAIRFDYHGYSLPIYPANETTVQLYRAFPWLPWPGIKNALMYENFYDYDTTESFFVDEWQRGDDVRYTLTYSGPGDLYTNLNNKTDNVYSGISSNGVSLYSGMAHSVHRNVDVYMPASQYGYAPLAADALLDVKEAIVAVCEMLNVKYIPKDITSVTVLEMDGTIILGYPFSHRSEIYTWDNEWEIHQTSASDEIIMRMRYDSDMNGYSTSSHALGAAVSYVLSPSSGYPVDAPHSSTVNFAYWLYTYISLSTESEPDLLYYIEAINERCGGQRVDYIAKVKVPETPITEEERARIEVIVRYMADGRNFDEPFNALYSRLMQSELVTPSDFIVVLFDAAQSARQDTQQPEGM
jgi:hypothetical protein